MTSKLLSYPRYCDFYVLGDPRPYTEVTGQVTMVVPVQDKITGVEYDRPLDGLSGYSSASGTVQASDSVRLTSAHRTCDGCGANRWINGSECAYCGSGHAEKPGRPKPTMVPSCGRSIAR